MRATRIALVGASGRFGAVIWDQIDQIDDIDVAVGITQRRHCEGGARRYVAAGDLFDLEPDEIDVVLDVSTPQGADFARRFAMDRSLPLVTGVTGLDEEQLALLESSAADIPVFVAANFSLGIAALMALLPVLARALGGADIDVIEHHHRTKKDSPSGTALRLVEAITSGLIGPDDSNRVPTSPTIHSIRGGGNPGEHTVLLTTRGEEFRVSHRALDRTCFAAGALEAVRWIRGKQPGRYGMADLVT
jgi:4-hydroxy-tetrahydrodipicolinate reductase